MSSFSTLILLVGSFDL